MRKNNAFCSICTLNYAAYAAVLNDSLRKAGHQDPHYVLIVDYDQKYEEIIEKFNFTPVFLPDLAIPKVDELIEKYSAFELSNVLKPFFMEWLLKNHAKIEKLIYLDTDVYVYSPLQDALDYLDKYLNISVAITPHLHDYKAHNGALDFSLEKMILQAGLYNGGFYAIKNDENALQFLYWQKKILFNYGYDGPNAQMFVDQKILDFAPIFFDFVGIYKNEAYNVAHWNYNEHPVSEKNNSYFVGNKKVVFFHFSHLKISRDITKCFLFDLPLNDKPVLQKMVFQYLESLRENGHAEKRKIPYGYQDRYRRPPLSLVNPLQAKTVEMDSIMVEMDSIKSKLEASNSQAKSLEDELVSAKEYLAVTKAELDRVYASRAFKIATVFWKIAKIPWRVVRKIKGGLLLSKSYAARHIKPRKRRKINIASKKILYIGHSYHNKTKSTEFLIDYLKKVFDVEVILDESWRGKPFPNLSFVDDSYLGVIFFQNLPNREIMENIKNDNLIFFPMYDGVGQDYNFWNGYQNLKIVNFSKTLDEKLTKWRFDSMHVQYFPEVREFTPGRKDEVFFWQRITKININTITKLFGAADLRIHIHKAIDPEHEFVAPSEEDEKKFQITHSDWFETREEMLDVIKQKGIYIAPRELEGIGLSFLEAMAMGKAVVAVNNPTMNEYIVDGKTGYLFDLSQPQKIDLSNIGQVQRNTHEFMMAGRKKWEESKHKIIDFIKKS